MLFGAAYYNEYQTIERLDLDLDLMQQANFSVIRVGESVWSTWEPEDNTFNLEWLEPILDGAHARGIHVILGTPTYALPPWLQTKHPELLAHSATGTPLSWGGRQEVDYSSPLFRTYAERIIRAVVGRYSSHPAVIGYQVDNEPGLELFHNPGTFAGFVQWLKARYGDTDTLNHEWGLVYWSHRISEWNQLWVPDGNTLPQYDLAWRTYQAELTTNFIGWQADIVREYADDAQFVTTCIAYPRPAVNDEELTKVLDITAGNPYYEMQDGLDATSIIEPRQSWASNSVWGLTNQADRMFASRQERFLVTETNAGAIGGSEQNYPPYPGQLAQAALALVARGASMIEYWHWHTLHFGTETYWVGILPHSQKPGRVYNEIAELGAKLRAIGPAMSGYTPDADVAFLYSTESKWALEFFPPLATEDHKPDRGSYPTIFNAFYRGVIESGAQARIVNVSQFLDCDIDTFVKRFPVLVVPGLYAASDDALERLLAYTESGGHLVIGPRTAYGDEEARARMAVAPPMLADVAGASYDEFSNIDASIAVKTVDVTAPSFLLSPGAEATRWIEGLTPNGADVMLGYVHHSFGRFAAMTSAQSGAGRVTVVGTVPNAVLGKDLGRWFSPTPISSVWSDLGVGVNVSSGINDAGERVWFVHNWTPEVANATTPADGPLRDLIGGDSIAESSVLILEPWSVRILVGNAGA
ncbi:beta-galactosidase [Salinibacterium sp. UTAS2018]|nr:beta-galactosidase [Salinibacterium sp. UTAS2018]